MGPSCTQDPGPNHAAGEAAAAKGILDTCLIQLHTCLTQNSTRVSQLDTCTYQNTFPIYRKYNKRYSTILKKL